MKPLKKLIILSIVLLLILLTGCGISGRSKDKDVSLIMDTGVLEDDELREMILYYRDNRGFIIPVMRRVPQEEGIGKTAINLLIDEPGLREDLALVGLLPVLPAGTEIIGMSINEGLAKKLWDLKNKMMGDCDLSCTKDE
jgi:germination protein M